jgi:tetratricopeptide (TPR) repeat protein
LKAVETFRKYVEARQEILRSNPEFKGARRGVANATIQLAFQMGRFGNRDEAMQWMNKGIAQYEALIKEGGNPDTIRELAASEQRRGNIELMRGEPAAAIVDFRHARDATARLAKRDPENTMLQSDMCGLEYEEGRALTLSGKASQGLALSQRALLCFRNLKLEADTGPGVGLLESWIGEAETRLHNLPEALKHYQNAAATLIGDVDKYDDARCDLAMVETKIGNTLLQMGKLSEASEHFTKAIGIANPSFSLERSDLPALYAAADGYFGLGRISAAQARATKNAVARAELQNEARRSYSNSVNISKQIPNPSAISGDGYEVGNPIEVAHQLAALGQI